MDTFSLTHILKNIPNTALNEVLQLNGLNLPPPITPDVAAQALVCNDVTLFSLAKTLKAVNMKVAARQVLAAGASSTENEAAYYQRMDIVTSHSSSGSTSAFTLDFSEPCLVEIKELVQRVIADSTALIESIGKSSFPNVTWFNVPDPASDFIGRFEELFKLSCSLWRNSSCSSAQIYHPILVGMGGVGKSELSFLYAHHARPFFRDHIRLIHAEDDVALTNSFRSFAHALGMAVEPQQTTDQLVDLVYAHISNFNECLLIFDNAADFRTIQAYIHPKFVQRSNKHRLFITSRSQDWGGFSRHGKIMQTNEMIQLQLWSKLEAVAYVAQCLSVASIDDCLILVAKLEFLPLAITLATSYIDLESTTIRDYLRLLDEYILTNYSLLCTRTEQDPAYRKAAGAGSPIHMKSVSSTFHITLQSLANQHKKRTRVDSVAGDALLIVHLISLISGTKIRQIMFDPLFEVHGAIRSADAFSLLLKYSLVQRQTFPGPCQEHTYSMHILMQAVIKQSLFISNRDSILNSCIISLAVEHLSEGLPIDELSHHLILKTDAIKAGCIGALAGLLVSPKFQGDQMKDLQLQRFVFKHAYQFFTFVDQHLSWLTSVFSHIFMPCFELWGNIAEQIGFSKIAKELLENCLHLAFRLHGPDHPDVAEILNNLANVHGSLGDYQAKKKLLEKSVTIFNNHFGPDHYFLIIPLLNLGSAYGFIGDHFTEKQVLKRALRIHQQHDRGANHIERAAILDNLGSSYGVLGKPLKKLTVLTEALRIKECHFGDNHIDLVSTLYNLANTHDTLGDSGKKMTLMQRALNIQESFFGHDHIRTAVVLAGVGRSHGLLGDHCQEMQIMERVVQIQERYYGANHIELVSSLVHLANAHGSVGKYARKKKLLKRALTICQTNGEDQSSYLADILMNLGSVYGSLGNHQNEVLMLEHAHQIDLEIHGEQSIQSAKTLTNLGRAYGSLGYHQKQMEVSKRALEIKEQFYGPDHVHVTSSLGNLANAHGAMGDFQSQQQLLERALAIRQRFYGDDHVEMASLLNELGVSYVRRGDYLQGLPILKRALRIQEQFYGPRHIEVGYSLNNLGLAYNLSGEHHLKKQVLERALEIKESFFGSSHPRVAKARKILLDFSSTPEDTFHDFSSSENSPACSSQDLQHDKSSSKEQQLAQILKRYANARDKNHALRRAAFKGCLKDVVILVEQLGADINAQDENPSSRKTALHHAWAQQHDHVAEWLISKEASSEIKDAKSATSVSDFTSNESTG